MNKITTGRSFSRASESPLNASKALNVRKQLYDTEQYQSNLKTANTFYTEAETSLLEVSDKLAGIRETIIAAVNSTKDTSTDLQIYAQQLETNASELCSIFNTDTAGRVIFGGESNDAEPFTIANDSNGNASTVLYHGVPLNAYSDADNFPASNGVYIDIGIGMVIDQDTQQIDPQSALKISFNGADITGCGSEGGVADIDLSSIKDGKTYTLDVYAGDVKKTISFTKTADTDAQTTIQNALDEAYKYSDVSPTVDSKGIVSVNDGTVCILNNTNVKDTGHNGTASIDNDTGYTDKYVIDLSSLSTNTNYSVKVTAGNTTKTISFTTGSNSSKFIDEINDALEQAFNPNGYTVNAANLKDGVDYTMNVKVGGSSKDITFTAADTQEGTIQNINDALTAAFNPDGDPNAVVPTVDENGSISAGDSVVTASGKFVSAGSSIIPVVGSDGKITAEGGSVTFKNTGTGAQIDVDREKSYSNNYIQLTLDAAKALRNGDIDYANGCIDRIVSASENLLVEIADLGCNEDYIEFNLERCVTRTTNLDERQDDLEATDLESEITLWKTYQSLYNACLQMSSSVVPNSIFNYIS
jgi:flagellin-like hook-associated protein FlgL